MAQVRTYSTPRRLYRYRPLGSTADREIQAILDASIYCSRFDQMNDPMEGKHKLSLRFAQNGQSEKQKEAVADAQRSIGIASLSEVQDHEPMWAHYADKFRGMCIAYKTKQLLSALPDDIDMVRMAYTEKPPLLLDDRTSAADRAKLALSSKTVRWASEREWRLFRPTSGAAQYKSVGIVARVYLGARVSAVDEDKVRSAMKRHNVPVLKMVIGAYAIEFNSTGRAKT